MKTKYEQIIDSVNRNWPSATEEQKSRVIKQDFAKFLARGRTIGRNLNTGELYVHGLNIALLI